MMPVIFFFIVPVIFFFIGFLFKKFRPYYKPIEFILFTMVLAVISVVLAFGSTLFVTMQFFIQAMLMYVTIYLVFAFMGLATDKIQEWFKVKYEELNGLVQLFVLLAVFSTMLLIAFSVQFIIMVAS